MRAVVIIIVSVFCGCVSTTSGTIYYGPEAMYFIECGKTEAYWLSSDSSKAVGWNKVDAIINSQPKCDLSTIPCEHQAAEVNGTVKIKSIGKFGHMGKYPKEVQFITIENVEVSGVCGT